MTAANEARAETEPLRMDAYYYGFDPTGVVEVDRILSAVARAGKAYHHTLQWCEDTYGGQGSPVEWIQKAANDAAAEWQASRTPDAASSDTDLADLILALRGNPANARGRWPNVKECAAAADALERLATSQRGKVEITDEQVNAAGRVMYPGWDRWLDDDPQAFGERELMRTALEAARGMRS